MITFLKKHIVGIMGTILISAIIGLSVVAYKQTNDTVIESENTSGEEIVPPVNIPVYESSIPKLPVSSNKYLYEQNIRGNGNIKLCNVLTTAFGTYIIAETDCRSGDISSDIPTVGMAKINSLGTVETTYSIKGNTELYYVNSCISNEGIVIIATDKTRSFLYVMITNYELTTTKTHVMPYSDSATLFTTKESFLIFSSSKDENYVVKYADGELVFSSTKVKNVVRTFEFSNYYRVFFNTPSGYGISDLDKDDFSIIKDIFVSSATLKEVIPLVEDGKQIYLAIESDSTLYVRKFSSEMSIANSTKKAITASELIACGNDADNLYLCVKGNINGVITLKKDLSFSYSMNTAEGITSNILDFLYGKEFLLLTRDNKNKLSVIKVNENGSESYSIAESRFGKIISHPNGTLAIVYDSYYYDYSDIKIVGIKE